jgi:hypothetical protein
MTKKKGKCKYTDSNGACGNGKVEGHECVGEDKCEVKEGWGDESSVQ